ncbi:hypothetical protein BDV06DRAFT_227007 [Aspergillus oleicola]
MPDLLISQPPVTKECIVDVYREALFDGSALADGEGRMFSLERAHGNAILGQAGPEEALGHKRHADRGLEPFEIDWHMRFGSRSEEDFYRILAAIQLSHFRQRHGSQRTRTERMGVYAKLIYDENFDNPTTNKSPWWSQAKEANIHGLNA